MPPYEAALLLTPWLSRPKFPLIPWQHPSPQWCWCRDLPLDMDMERSLGWMPIMKGCETNPGKHPTWCSPHLKWIYWKTRVVRGKAQHRDAWCRARETNILKCDLEMSVTKTVIPFLHCEGCRSPMDLDQQDAHIIVSRLKMPRYPWR